MEIAFKFISKYLYFSPKKKHFHKDLRSTYHVTNIPQIARVLKYIKDNIKKQH